MARYSSLSPEDLVKASVGSNDPAAWDEFFRRFRPVIATVVLRTARRWTEPPRQLLDDLTQDTFLKLCADDCRLLRSFEPRHADAIFGFFKKIAANVVHDHFKAERAMKRGAGKTDSLPDQGRSDPAAINRSSSDGLERHVLLRQIETILDRFVTGEEKQRNCTIFWLHHLQGLSASEIASLPYIGLTTKGVETILRRMLVVIQSHIRDASNGNAAGK